jgi:glycosyltransferase involved in cell wall biosynthesis
MSWPNEQCGFTKNFWESRISPAMRRPNIAFLVNGDVGSAMGIRARSFAARLTGDFQIRIAYRSGNKVYSILRFLGLLLRVRPTICYVLDMGFSGVLGAGLYRFVSRCPTVVDTGDAIFELSRNSGSRGRFGLWLTKLLEQFALSISDRVVVRSHPHQDLLASRGISAIVIPDGVDTEQFRPQAENDLRRKRGLEGFTVIGLLGSLIWNSRWQMCYGWELIELMDRLRDRSVKGLIIGDGSGLSKLEAQCSARGLEDRITFAGRVPYDDLPQYLNLMDICLSTQTNDMAGQVRTTGKLPLYLACGRFVLASEVGEAARVLPPAMLVPYHGTNDSEYPSRLADRVRSLLKHPERLQEHAASVAVARAHFDYSTLTDKLRQTIYDLLPPRYGNPEQQSMVPMEIEPHGSNRL